MATTSTTELGLIKPTPGTKEPYTVANENSNSDKIDALFHTSTGHDHSGAHKGAPVTRLSTAVTLSGATTLSGASVTLSSQDFTARRLKVTGTALVDADFVASSGWGSTRTIQASSGAADVKGSFVVTAGGTGISANPTAVLTFKDLTWTTAPTVLCQITGGSGAGSNFAINVTSTTTAVTFQMFFTPTTGLNYIFSYICLGGPT